MMESVSTAPVTQGQQLHVIPTGKSKEDPFYSCHGFIIFIKGLPESHIGTAVTVKVTNVKEKYAFAQYVPPSGKDW